MRKLLLLTAFVLFGFASGAYAKDIQLTWTPPTHDVDGYPLSKIDGYVIYYSIDNVAQANIEVGGAAIDYLVTDVAPGSHMFQIATLANGHEGAPSTPIDKDIKGPGAAARIEIIVTVVD